MKVLFIGDIFGRPGRDCIEHFLPKLKQEHTIDVVVANGENAAGGLGITPDILDTLKNYGIQAFTFGNHTWRKKAFVKGIERYDCVARPANYPEGTPGRGSTVVTLPDGRKLGVINVIGRVYMEAFDCPFEVADREVDYMSEETNCILVDMHAEATSEKVAMGWYLDGKCSAVVGTHTHIQTADERILPQGTAYISDVGMTGPQDSVIGVRKELIVEKFVTGMPINFEVSTQRPGIRAVVIELDDESGKALSIERISQDLLSF